MGQKVTCPNCGDVNVIRSLGNAAPSTDRAAAAGYPPALGPEADVILVRPAMFRARPLRFLILSLLLIGGAVGAVFFTAGGTAGGANIPLAVTCATAGVLAFLWLMVWKIHTLGESLQITTKRTIDKHGLFSKDTSDVLHVDIKNIQIKQTFLDRLWNVGQIALSSSAENEEEIVIKNIPNPEKVRQIIDLYRQL
jgi:uncharacterized membrane protein YdbT with pleckstrin-like domain